MSSKSALQRVQEAESNHAAALGQVQQAHDLATKWSGIAEMARSELLQEKDEQIQQLNAGVQEAANRADAAEAQQKLAVEECDRLRAQINDLLANLNGHDRQVEVVIVASEESEPDDDMGDLTPLDLLPVVSEPD